MAQYKKRSYFNLFVILSLILHGCSHLNSCEGYYFPGIFPTEYKSGEPVELKVNMLTSDKTGYSTHYYSVPFCDSEAPTGYSDNLIEILQGDGLRSSPYEVHALSNKECHILCSKKYNGQEVSKFIEKIKHDYRVNWLMDNLPAAISRVFRDSNGETINSYDMGFPIGNRIDSVSMSSNDKYYLYNHVNMKVKYGSHREEDDHKSIRIISFEVEPESIHHGELKEEMKCPSNSSEDRKLLTLELPENQNFLEVIWTYSVQWEESFVEWTQRWDKYIINQHSKIPWFSIVNSLMVVLFLTGMVAMIMMRTLHQDFRRYNKSDFNQPTGNASSQFNSMQLNEGLQLMKPKDEAGWKLIHGDVLRTPQNPMLLSVLAGSGVHLIGMLLIVMVMSGFSHAFPSNRNGFLFVSFILFAVTGTISGFMSANNYRIFKGKSWKKLAWMSSLFFPSTVFSVLITLNTAIWGGKSAVPIATMSLLILSWFVISIPLTFLGSYFGYHKNASKEEQYENLRVNEIPSKIPELVWYMRPVPSILAGGILPFGAVFMELVFIFSINWGKDFYFIFGLLFVVSIILVMTCAEIAIVMCYYQLCNGDYHWWWRSYLTAGTSSVYIFLYCVFHFFTKLKVLKLSSMILYFGYSFLLSFVFLLVTGTIGYYSCLVFVKKIYSLVKLD